MTSYNLCYANPFQKFEITACVIRNYYWMRRFPSKVQIVCGVGKFPRKIGPHTLTYVYLFQPSYPSNNPCGHGIGDYHVRHKLIQNFEQSSSCHLFLRLNLYKHPCVRSKKYSISEPKCQTCLMFCDAHKNVMFFGNNRNNSS